MVKLISFVVVAAVSVTVADVIAGTVARTDKTGGAMMEHVQNSSADGQKFGVTPHPLNDTTQSFVIGTARACAQMFQTICVAPGSR